jgi:maltose alpha-D-glucosyltransferase/alpha-amylase
MVTEEERQWMWEEYAPLPRMRLNLGIRRRLAPLLDNDHRKILLANALLFSLPGAPIIYYGDEIGMGDNIWLPDRNGVRTPMQWDDSLNAGFSDAPPDELYAPVIDEGEYAYETVNVAAETKEPDSLLNKMKHLIDVRKSHPIFATGDYQFLHKDQTELLIVLRSQESENVVCVLNLTDEKQTLSLDLAQFSGRRVFDLVTEKPYPDVTEKPYQIYVLPFGFFWLTLVS